MEEFAKKGKLPYILSIRPLVVGAVHGLMASNLGLCRGPGAFFMPALSA